jgi:hypothetical protein
VDIIIIIALKGTESRPNGIGIWEKKAGRATEPPAWHPPSYRGYIAHFQVECSPIYQKNSCTTDTSDRGKAIPSR